MPRLRRSDCNGDGIARRRRGRGFSYHWSDGSQVTDVETLDRIRALAIPPAWKDVWICPWPHGHIQAVGTDDAGRRQYRYHDAWRAARDREKFDRSLRFGAKLPAIRKQVATDLAAEGLEKERVLAAIVRLLDLGLFRIGSEEYADEHETFGVSTLERRHAKVTGERVEFDYMAKGSIRRRVSVEDATTARLVATLKRRRSTDGSLFAYKEGRRWKPVRAEEVNVYLREVSGEDFSAKDFRTWAGTVLAATELVVQDQADRGRKRTEREAIARVAQLLGNTAAVCRASYIDPRVIERYEHGETISHAVARCGESPADDPEGRSKLERAVLVLLEDEDDAASRTGHRFAGANGG